MKKILIGILLLFLSYAVGLSQGVGERYDNFPLGTSLFNDQSRENTQGDILSQLHRMNPDGVDVLYVHDPALMEAIQGMNTAASPIQSLGNGLVLNGTVGELGAPLIRNTEIDADTFSFNLTHDDKSFLKIGDGIGTLGMVNNGAVLEKVDGNTFTSVGVGDASTLGGATNAGSIFCGDIAAGAYSSLSISQTEVSLITQKIGHTTNISFRPHNPIPFVNQFIKNTSDNMQMGFEAVDDIGVKRYANIYYSDASGSTENISRVEVSDLGATMFFRYDVPNDKDVDLVLDGSGLLLKETDTGDILSADLNGEITLHQYPDSRDDSGTTTPENIIYTDSGGGLKSTAISSVLKFKRDFYTLAGGETSLTLSGIPNTASNVIVSKEGLTLYEGASEDWTLSGNVISFVSYTGVAGEKVEVKYF